MQENIWVEIFWVACVATAIVASVLATWSRRARYIGRVAVGVLMLLGGAAFNAVNLALRGDYAGFADQAHFGLVTTAWRAVVAPNQLLFIGLLVAFEAVVGGADPQRWTEDATRPAWSDRVPRGSVAVRLRRDDLLRSHGCFVGVAAPRRTARCQCFCRRSRSCVPRRSDQPERLTHYYSI